MANASEPVIRVEGVQKSFGANHVLRGVDFEVMPGEVVTIIGASGSGKSTLLRCINLLETPDAGHVWFHGEDLAAEHVNVNRLRESIGMVFQGFNLFNNMNVMENCVLAPVTLKKCSRAEAEERARKHLAEVGLLDFAQAPVVKLSGGQKQRVAIARALIHNRSILLVDEGTSALDQKNADIVEKSLLSNPDLTLILISHHLSDERKAQFDHVYELTPASAIA